MTIKELNSSSMCIEFTRYNTTFSFPIARENPAITKYIETVSWYIFWDVLIPRTMNMLYTSNILWNHIIKMFGAATDEK